MYRGQGCGSRRPGSIMSCIRGEFFQPGADPSNPGGQFAVEDAADAGVFRSQMALAIESPFTCTTDLTQFRWETVACRVESLIQLLARS